MKPILLLSVLWLFLAPQARAMELPRWLASVCELLLTPSFESPNKLEVSAKFHDGSEETWFGATNLKSNFKVPLTMTKGDEQIELRVPLVFPEISFYGMHSTYTQNNAKKVLAENLSTLSEIFGADSLGTMLGYGGSKYVYNVPGFPDYVLKIYKTDDSRSDYRNAESIVVSMAREIAIGDLINASRQPGDIYRALTPALANESLPNKLTKVLSKHDFDIDRIRRKLGVVFQKKAKGHTLGLEIEILTQAVPLPLKGEGISELGLPKSLEYFFRRATELNAILKEVFLDIGFPTVLGIPRPSSNSREDIILRAIFDEIYGKAKLHLNGRYSYDAYLDLGPQLQNVFVSKKNSRYRLEFVDF